MRSDIFCGHISVRPSATFASFCSLPNSRPLVGVLSDHRADRVDQLDMLAGHLVAVAEHRDRHVLGRQDP
jgi:hypothetical protein